MKRVILCFFVLFLSLFNGCSLFYDLEDDGEFAIGYCKIYNNAFVGLCYWDGDLNHMTITIPDTYNGLKITDLGGYFGRGVPVPFKIAPQQSLSIDWSGDIFDEEFETLRFTVIIGKYIEKLEYVSGKEYWGIDIKSEDGTLIGHDALYKIVYYFEVDENNPTFYSDEGKLYYRDTEELIDEFFYE